MRFLLSSDEGDVIRGWVVPDNPLAISRVSVSIEGRRVAEVSAIHTDPNFIHLGWHATGQCHFEIRDTDVPGLAGIERLEIYDVDTNVMIYRRTPDAGLTDKKAILLMKETAKAKTLAAWKGFVRERKVNEKRKANEDID